MVEEALNSPILPNVPSLSSNLSTLNLLRSIPDTTVDDLDLLERLVVGNREVLDSSDERLVGPYGSEDDVLSVEVI